MSAMGAEAYLEAVMSIWAEKGERTSCPISGNCMAPTIRQGDLLVIEHGESHLRKGDILIYKKDDKLLAHRLVYAENTGSGTLLYTKADRKQCLDPPITQDRIQGKVIEVQGGYGRLRFASRFWIVSNYALAALSHATAVDSRSRAPLRYAVRAVRKLRSRILPARFSLPEAFARVLCATYRTLFRAKA
jgi:signal peptidase I